MYLASRLRRGHASSFLHVARDGARLDFLAGRCASSRPRSRSSASRRGTACPTTGSRPTPPSWRNGCAPWCRLAAGSGPAAAAGAHLGQRAGAEGAAARPWCARRICTPVAGARVDRDALLAYLERNGYHRTSAVVEAGDYAVRGGLVDIFPSGLDQPVRLDFFGSTLEFDPQLRPAHPALAGQGRPAGADAGQRGAARRRGDRARSRAAICAISARSPATRCWRRWRPAAAFAGMEHWLPLFHPNLVPLTAYLDAECEVGLDHLALDAIKARAALIGEHYEARLQPPLAGTSFGTAPYRALPPELLYLDEGGVERALEPHPRLQLSHLRPAAATARRDRPGPRPGRASGTRFRARAPGPLGQPVRRDRGAPARARRRRRAAVARRLQRGHARAAEAGPGRSRLRHADQGRALGGCRQGRGRGHRRAAAGAGLHRRPACTSWASTTCWATG